MKHFKRVTFILIGLIVTICLSGFGYVYFKLNKMYVKDEVVKSTEEQGTMVEGITNILLVGTDGEYVEKGNRSDGMMLVTIDSKNKDIKLTSIARDTYVDIPGYSTEKLTHAYAFGGPELAINTINRNFNLNIKDFVTVNFSSLPKIIDKIGGIDIEVDEEELQYINGYINNKKEKYTKIRYFINYRCLFVYNMLIYMIHIK